MERTSQTTTSNPQRPSRPSWVAAEVRRERARRARPDVAASRDVDHASPVAVPRDLGRSSEQALLARALPLLDLVALAMWRHCGGQLELDELASAGREALVPLVRRFDPARTRLEAYLNPRLRWAMRDAVRRETHSRARGLVVREPSAAVSPVVGARGATDLGELRRAEEDESPTASRPGRSLSQTDIVGGLVVCSGDMSDAPDPGRDPEQLTVGVREARQLWDVVALLPERERRLVEGHYGRGARMDRLAAAMGISKTRASRIHRRALGRLETMLRERAVARPPLGRGSAARH